MSDLTKTQSLDELGKLFKFNLDIFLMENKIKNIEELSEKLIYAKKFSGDLVLQSSISAYFHHATKGSVKGKFPKKLLSKIKYVYGVNNSIFDLCSNFNHMFDYHCDFMVRLDEEYSNLSLTNFIAPFLDNTPHPTEYISLDNYKSIMYDNSLKYPTIGLLISLFYYVDIRNSISSDIEKNWISLKDKLTILLNNYLKFFPALYMTKAPDTHNLIKIQSTICNINYLEISSIYNIIKKDQEVLNLLKELIIQFELTWTSFPDDTSPHFKHLNTLKHPTKGHFFSCKIDSSVYFPAPIYIN